MTAAQATGFAAPTPPLDQFFDDLDRFTIWDVARDASHLGGVRSVDTATNYADIGQGIAPERASLTRTDGAVLTIAFTIDLEMLPDGNAGKESITGWVWKSTDQPEWHTCHAHGSLAELYEQISNWANDGHDDDLPTFSTHLRGASGTIYRLVWKPLRIELADGRVEQAWHHENFPPARWSKKYWMEQIQPDVHVRIHGGGLFTAKQVDSVDDLTSGSFALIAEG